MNGANILQIHETGGYRVLYPRNFGREGLLINLQSLAALLRNGKRQAGRSQSAMVK
jgi:hypothetical protein